jgi:K+-sensing histidine kinase KdpD
MPDSQMHRISSQLSSAMSLLGKGVKTIACLVLLGVLAIALSAVMFRLVGGVQGWQSWRTDNYWHLVAWRMTLYVGLVTGWLTLKARFHKQDAEQSDKRLRRVEIMAALLVLLIELSKIAVEQGDFL